MSFYIPFVFLESVVAKTSLQKLFQKKVNGLTRNCILKTGSDRKLKDSSIKCFTEVVEQVASRFFLFPDFSHEIIQVVVHRSKDGLTIFAQNRAIF